MPQLLSGLASLFIYDFYIHLNLISGFEAVRIVSSPSWSARLVVGI